MLLATYQIKSNQIIYFLRNKHLLTVYKTGEPDSKAPNKKHKQLRLKLIVSCRNETVDTD